jgi:ABC-type antimicrobial peptide transport system ATPase subunit
MNKNFVLNILFKYVIFFSFILLAIFVGLFRQHTSNFGWNGAISIETLSSGQIQRISLLRDIINSEGKIVMIDEVMS